MTDDDGEYQLLFPFVVCASEGGPYDDRAFVAGVRFGQILEQARTLAPGRSMTWTVEPVLVPQLDLLAMHHDWRITTEPDSGEWVQVTFRR